MSTAGEDHHPTRASMRPQRVLACTLCSQRKVKCDRKFPCANCTKAGVQCFPAALVPRQRKRRFPERELLDRLQRYEELLRQHDVKFEPTHEDKQSNEDPASPSQKSETVYEARSLWQAMTQAPDGEESDESEDSPFNHEVRDTIRRKTWENLHSGNDQLLFGQRMDPDLSSAHPDQVKIFKLWQIYLENIDPLLKVTHTPTLQPRLIDAASDLTNIDPPLEALMFAIYCISTLSLDDDGCQSLFGASRKELLARHQVGCQQALINCGILRSQDRDCLTALFLYLVSLRDDTTDPRTLSPMLGVAVRLAQRMGIHNEAWNAKEAPLEAEMRRRLWWSIVMFDQRISELSDAKTTMLLPTWDCSTPLNVNDFDLRQEMKTPPPSQDRPSEAVFSVARTEICDIIRHSPVHLDFTNPALKGIARGLPEGGLAAVERMLEEKYLQYCNPDNPLHYMTIWMARGMLAKTRLLQHFLEHSARDLQTEEQRDQAISHAMDILVCDTKFVGSPLTKGFQWLAHYYFPLPAYMNIARDLGKRPTAAIGESAWRIMSENYRARFSESELGSPVFAVFAKLILFTWTARETAFRKLGQSLHEPEMITSVKKRAGEFMENKPPSMNPAGPEMQDDPSLDGGTLPDLPSMDFDIDPLDWSAIDWNPVII